MLNTQLLQNLDNLVISHPLFNTILDSLMAQVQYRCRGQIPMVVGPTGVGKTTLIHMTNNELYNYVHGNPELGYSPPIILEANSPETGDFSWKDFYQRGLVKLSEPGIERKSDIDQLVADLKSGHKKSSFRYLTVFQLRDLFYQALNIRKPIAVFIDEVQSLAKTKSKVRKSDNLDVLKSMSNHVDTVLIPVGTYEARDMLYHGGQLSRRVSIHHFHRYGVNNRPTQTFKAIISSIEKNLSIPFSINIKKDTHYLYVHSAGCIGILLDWIKNAIRLGIRNNRKVISKDDLEATRLSNIQLEAIYHETRQFEEEHEQSGDFDIDLFNQCQTEAENNDAEVRSKSNKKPGKRGPGRDSVGMEEE